jgi:hypothetical protein
MSSQSQLQSLAQRRAELVARAETDRVRLAYYYRQIQAPVRLMQTGWGVASNLRRSPLLVTAVAALLIRSPWRRAARLPKLVWRGWQVLQFVRGWAR